MSKYNYNTYYTLVQVLSGMVHTEKCPREALHSTDRLWSDVSVEVETRRDRTRKRSPEANSRLSSLAAFSKPSITETKRYGENKGKTTGVK